ncbi:MAG: aspartate kinase [Bdellovibrionales bacterium]|nr:aspartate kinase [Bdellovibrionales bacterium]
MIVAKFGGSSVKDASGMQRCSDIIKNSPDIQIVILSATFNTTNELEKMGEVAKTNYSEALSLLKFNKYKHELIMQDLGITEEHLFDLYQEAQEILTEINDSRCLTPKLMDHLYSIGERVSTKIFYLLLQKEFKNRDVCLQDSSDIIQTNESFNQAIPNIEFIKNMSSVKLIPQLRNKRNLIVMQGFIGKTSSGDRTTLGREGSDYSAALIAEAIDASSLEIWTDVAGIATCDPRYFNQYKIIPALSYDDATLLAENGAKILFPKTLLPVKRGNIPVRIKSSLFPEKKGTLVSNHISNCRGIISINIKETKDFEVRLVGNVDQSIELFNDIAGFNQKNLCFTNVTPDKLNSLLTQLHLILFDDFIEVQHRL